MANVCEITGKKKLKGHRVSHANNKSIHFQKPNIQRRWLFVPELGIKFGLNVCAAGLRTLDKNGGLSRFLAKARLDRISPRLLKLRKLLLTKGVQ